MENKLHEIKIKTLQQEVDKLKATIEKFRSDNNSFIYSALSKAQSEIPIIQKDSKAYGNQRYASWASIKKNVTPILSKYGLSILQEPVSLDGRHYIKTTVGHSSGQNIYSMFEIPVFITEKTVNPKNEWGCSLSYFKRHIYCCVLGIATDEDID